MTLTELSNSHKRLLTVLVNKHQQEETPVKAKAIGPAINRTPGSIRNQMQTLKQLGLVDGVSGPNGGYEPTERAYDHLDRDQLADPESVILSREYDRVRITVDDIDFINVDHPEECKAYVHFQQSVDDVDVDDPIAVGPTPVSRLGLAGQVMAISDTSDTLLVDIERLTAPLEP